MGAYLLSVVVSTVGLIEWVFLWTSSAISIEAQKEKKRISPLKSRVITCGYQLVVCIFVIFVFKRNGFVFNIPFGQLLYQQSGKEVVPQNLL